MNFSSFFRIAMMSVAMFGLLSPMVVAQQTAKSKSSKSSLRDTVRVVEVPSVTVTTTRAKEAISPIPFAEISRAELKEQHTVTDIPVLLSDMPSSFFYSENGNGVGYSYLKMRGFDQRRIAVMINGIPQNDPEDHNVYWIDVPDAASNMQSIQVQRGAGLMNYGSAAIGGSISLTSANFADSRFIRLSSGIGYQQHSTDDKTVFAPITGKFSAEISSGLTDKYALYARLSRINSNGYRDLSWAELNSFFVSAVRFDDNITTQINIFGGPISDGLAYNGLPKAYIGNTKLRRLNYNDFDYDSTGKTLSYSVNRRPQEVEGFSQPHYEILNDVFLADNLTLKSSLFYYTGAGYFDYDAYWADAATLRLTPEFGFPAGVTPANAIIRATVENKQGGWIPRLVLKHDDGELTFGAELRKHKSYHYGKVQFAEGLPSGMNPDFMIYDYNGYRQILSAFAREQYRISDATLFTVEWQLVSNDYTIGNEKAGGKFTEYRGINGEIISGNGDIFTVNYLFFNPRIGLTHSLSEEMNVYASAAITSREPRMKNLYAAEDAFSSTRISPLFVTDTIGGIKKYDFTQPLVKPERMIDIEAGTRYRTTDGKFSGALNLYWMEFSNELVKSGRIDIFGNPIDGNASRSRHIGIEAEAMATLYSSGNVGTFSLSGNVTVSRNRFVEYDYFQKGSMSAISLADLPIAGFPDVLANIRLTYTAGGLWASVILKQVGGFYSDNFGEKLGELRGKFPDITSYADNKLESYSTVNMDVSYQWNSILSLQSVRLHGHCTNLLNSLYAASAEGKDFYPAAERGFYFGIDLGL
ncbi:MAG: TonB-dependent receptor [Bacteroidetes bacterium]|nr:TonB-dependent receptor [Bacteroidota bacterium]